MRAGQHILVVCGDAQVQEQLATPLSQTGFELGFACDWQEAFAIAQGGRCDLILLDARNPDNGAGELLKRLKHEPSTESIPVIALIDGNVSGASLALLDLGADDYMSFPSSSPELVARIKVVSRNKHALEQLRKAYHEMVVARDAAERSARGRIDFLARMSHEIRTPMNGVIAMAGLLLETTLTREQRGYVETIYSCGNSLLAILNDILDLAKIDAGKLELVKEPFDLRKCVEEAVDVLAPQAGEKRVELTCVVDQEIPARFRGDAVRLRQVLVNLLSNAVKFTSEGEVAVSVNAPALPASLTGPDKVSQAVSGRPDAPVVWHLQFSVRDTGIGIPPERLARLFQPFSQADPTISKQFGGTGLGLAISKRLVELMGGKMWVESVPQRGSTFYFTLPLETVPDAFVPEETRPAPELADKRLLIVDDNATSCRMLMTLTSAWGMAPRATQNAVEALRWLSDGEKFDLALLDMEMPGFDGFLLAREIRKLPNGNRMPLVLLSPIGVHAESVEFTTAGFVGLLMKPIKPARLKEVLRQTFSGSKPAAPQPQPEVKPEQTLAARLPLRILVADDNKINQKVAVRLLQQMGYQPDVAANGREVLSALDKQPYDLIFMDVLMPEMDGLEATRAIRERQKQTGQFPNYKPPLIIVAMTASAMAGDREKCIDAGMDDYLAKPVRLEDVRRILERWGPVAIGDNDVASKSLKSTQPNATMSQQNASTQVEQTEPSPVDINRLVSMTEGTEDSVRELIGLYLSQTAEQFEQIKAAIASGDAPTVRRLAHSCVGASATCGVGRLVPLLRQLERIGQDGTLGDAQPVFEQLLREFERVKEFFADEQHIKRAIQTSVKT